MPSFSARFHSPPAGLGPEQLQKWAHRLLTVEEALAGLTAEGTVPDDAILAHLQDYVNNDITLGQALGRIVDHRAQQSGPLP